MNLSFSDHVLDPDRNPDHHQNVITWSLGHTTPLQKISSKSVHNFLSNLSDRQTDRQTDKQTVRHENITYLGGGNNSQQNLSSVKILGSLGLTQQAAQELSANKEE